MPLAKGMSTGPINSLSSSYLQAILSPLQDAGLSINKTDASSLVQPPDKSRLSPFAQVMSTLQQLQQSDPTKYQQITQQIAANLQSAAQTAQSEGNTTAANKLNQLANDFAKASESGQLPNVQDLARAIHGHHHHHRLAAADADGNSTGASGSTSQPLSQFLSALQANGAQNNSQDPATIILSTLSNAAISNPNS
jgi:hypothetical protein